MWLLLYDYLYVHSVQTTVQALFSEVHTMCILLKTLSKSQRSAWHYLWQLGLELQPCWPQRRGPLWWEKQHADQSDIFKTFVLGLAQNIMILNRISLFVQDGNLHLYQKLSWLHSLKTLLSSSVGMYSMPTGGCTLTGTESDSGITAFNSDNYLQVMNWDESSCKAPRR